MPGFKTSVPGLKTSPMSLTTHVTLGHLWILSVPAIPLQCEGKTKCGFVVGFLLWGLCVCVRMKEYKYVNTTINTAQTIGGRKW